AFMPGTGIRQLQAWDGDGLDITQAEDGTLYFTSNAGVVEVDANGLVQSRAVGVATISIINAGGQTDIPVVVQAPSNGATAVG
ncbi:hypothetical protein ACC798_36400, partial [Rhizobium ruizarguesonis]